MRFQRKEEAPVVCARCSEEEALHEWRCTRCGAVSRETEPCGCGQCQLPKPNCECKASWSLFCRDAVRRHDPKLYEELVELRRLHASIPEGGQLWENYAWEEGEAERLKQQANGGSA